MEDPVIELQSAMIALLRNDTGVRALVEDRTFDRPPQKQNGDVAATLPYISAGPAIYESENADCIIGGRITIQIDAWSDRPGKTEVGAIAHAVRCAVRGTEIELQVNALVSLEHLRSDYSGNGLFESVAIRFVAIVEEP